MVKAKKDYSKGKIYRLVCNTTGIQYIGSTTKYYLSDRLSEHRSSYKRWLETNKSYTSSYIIIEMDNFDIILVESYPCKSKDELKARERHWIEKIDCVNKYFPTRTKREYYQDNREHILNQFSQYRQAHKDKMKEYLNQYRQDNKGKLVEQNRHYYQDNKDKISQNRSEKVLCECGSEISKRNISTHKKSVKHQEWVNSQL